MGSTKKIERRAFSRAEIADFARLIRKLIGAHHRTRPNLLEIFALLQRIFPKLRLRIVPDNVSPRGEARAYPASWIIKIRQGIADGLERGDAGARWTFAHELGHILLRHPGKPFRNRQAAQDALEREAHIFAAEFLAPSHLVVKYQSASELQKTFQISSEAAQRRIGEAARYTESLRDSVPSDYTDIAKLEDDIPIINEAIIEALADKPPLLAVEPFRNSLFGATVLVAKGAELLRDAYESICGTQPFDVTVRAATVVAAIIAIRPIREIGGSTGRTLGEIAKLNDLCALKAASKLLGFTKAQVDSEILSDRSETNPLFFPAEYLGHLTCLGEDLMADSSATIELFQLPRYFDYNDKLDVSWSEINALTRIINLLALMKSASSNS